MILITLVIEFFYLFSYSVGSIDLKELKAAMKALGFDVTKEEIKKMLSGIDMNNNGEIELDEFVKLMTGRMVFLHFFIIFI